MVDISGEFNYIDGSQVKYHDKAKEVGVYIVSACGWDSIPTEIGLNFLRRQFGASELDTAEGFQTMVSNKPVSINHGTLDSIAEMVARTGEIKQIRKELFSKYFKKKYPTEKRKLQIRLYPHYRENIGWCVPFYSENVALANVSSAWFWEIQDERPIQYFEYFAVPRLWMAIMIIIAMFYLYFMCYFSFTRKLLTSYPEIFTLMAFSKVGPPKKQLKDLRFYLELIGIGTGPDSSTKTVKCSLSGPDAGYETTSRCMIQAGISILDESDKMPFSGGVIPPGFAFRNTSIVERLILHGIDFKVLSQ